MKLRSLFLLFCSVLFIYSCGEDTTGGGGTNTNNPKVTFGGNAGADETVAACQTLTMPLNATKGTNELNGIEVLEDGVKVAADRITFKGSTVGGNPFLLFGADRAALTNAELKVKASCNGGTKTISVSIIDALNNKTTVNKKVTVNATPPTSKYVGPAVVTDVTANTLNNFKFDVIKSGAKIVSVEVQEDSVKIADVSRLQFDGKTFTSNPEVLPATAQDGFIAKNVGVRLPAKPGTYKYNFIFRDEAGLSTSQQVTVSVGTPIGFTKFGIFWNQSGPNFGGLDLDEGLNVAYTSSLAEIIDTGIDSTQTDKAKNWKQLIRGVNGTEIKLLKRAAEVEITWTLESIKYTDQIKSLFSIGKPVTNQKIAKEDIIVAKKGDKFYILEVSNVIVTPNDNTDKYEVNIKH